MGSPLLYQTVGKVHSREGIYYLPDIVVDVCSDVNLIPEDVAGKLGLVYSHTNAFDFRTPTGEQVSIRYYTYFLLTIAGVTMKVKAYIIPKVVVTTFPLLLGLNWMKEVHDDLQHHRLVYRSGGYETLVKGMRKRYKLVKKKIVVVEVGFLEIEEVVENSLIIEYPTLVEPEIEAELVVEEPALVEMGIEEEPAVKEVIQGDKLPELLEEDPTAEEHGTEDIIELLNSAIQDPVVEDPSAKGPLIKGEAFQKVVMDVKVTTRGSDGCWQADITRTGLMQRRAMAIGGYSAQVVQERRGID